MSRFSSASPPAPEVPLDLSEEAFWHVVRDAAGDIEIHAGSEQMLRDMIRAGINRMRGEGRDQPDDIVRARRNLVIFVSQMTEQAQKLGHPDWLGEDTTDGATEYFFGISNVMAGLSFGNGTLAIVSFSALRASSLKAFMDWKVRSHCPPWALSPSLSNVATNPKWRRPSGVKA